MPETPTDLDTDAGMPWLLLPSETVCRGCNYTHHKHLPACPTCKELAR